VSESERVDRVGFRGLDDLADHTAPIGRISNFPWSAASRLPANERRGTLRRLQRLAHPGDDRAADFRIAPKKARRIPAVGQQVDRFWYRELRRGLEAASCSTGSAIISATDDSSSRDG